jgi:hypothetical protein
MVAVTADTDDVAFAFKNVCGVLALQLKGSGAVKSISVKGNSDEILCGEAIVTAAHGKNPEIELLSSSSKTVTLDCGESGVELQSDTPTSFLISLPSVSFDNGFTVTVTDVSGKSNVHPCMLHDMIDEGGGGSFAVRSRNAKHFSGSITGCKFNFRDDGDACLHDFLNHRGGIRNSGTLNHLRSVKDLRFRVLPFFPTEVVGIKHALVVVLDASHVGHKDVVSLLLRKDGCAHAAFGSAKYSNFHL